VEQIPLSVITALRNLITYSVYSVKKGHPHFGELFQGRAHLQSAIVES